MRDYGINEVPKEGDSVNFYLNHLLNEGLLGEGTLIQKTEEMSPLTFIVNDSHGSPRLQEVWSYEKWQVKVSSITKEGEFQNIKVGDILERRIRRFARIGVMCKSVEKVVKSKKYSEIVDNFELIPGMGQCF